MNYLLQSKEGLCEKSRERYESAVNDAALNPLRQIRLLNTTAETFYAVLRNGKPCTNMYLRRIHSFALQLGVARVASHLLQSMAQAALQGTSRPLVGRTSVARQHRKERGASRLP